MAEPSSDEAGERNPSTSNETAPKTETELQNALDRLAQTAYVNGVEISDVSFALRHDGHGYPDWEVVFVRLEKRTDPEE